MFHQYLTGFPINVAEWVSIDTPADGWPIDPEPGAVDGSPAEE